MGRREKRVRQIFSESTNVEASAAPSSSSGIGGDSVHSLIRNVFIQRLSGLPKKKETDPDLGSELANHFQAMKNANSRTLEDEEPPLSAECRRVLQAETIQLLKENELLREHINWVLHLTLNQLDILADVDDEFSFLCELVNLLYTNKDLKWPQAHLFDPDDILIRALNQGIFSETCTSADFSELSDVIMYRSVWMDAQLFKSCYSRYVARRLSDSSDLQAVSADAHWLSLSTDVPSCPFFDYCASKIALQKSTLCGVTKRRKINHA